MGNYRFRLSDMMPNSWFYKLKDMSKATAHNPPKKILHHPKPTSKRPKSSSSSKQFPPQSQLYIPNRASYYFPSRVKTEKTPVSPSHHKALDTHFPISPPRKSKKTAQKKPIKPSPQPSSTDIIIDMKSLKPIQTKPTKTIEAEIDGKHIMLKRAQQGLHRIKVKPSSPKVEIKNLQAGRYRRMANSKKLGESFAVVKKSADPRRDFRESMVEMIVEHDIRASRDLEELLACYLSLNSEEYHGVIVKVFEEIWIDLTEVRV
ncbi:uncharacterized protein A4U43_C07F5560 [Asparagus officinalis]|uniref:Transcription repressor n=1 Tax=Asparagus officinalis TaxID=4686 RepID=A0A5P1EBK9_ASPOF|nr:transcription repressor OFP3-like [Asparagus officinalis]ONK62577.1 uncharacterized protein A4U43_C07F5560 [Asparagus officinalis]